MFNFHEGREWLLCQDKWNLLLETTEVGMKIIIKKYEKAFERICIEVALGNSSRKTVFVRKNTSKWENKKAVGLASQPNLFQTYLMRYLLTLGQHNPLLGFFPLYFL